MNNEELKLDSSITTSSAINFFADTGTITTSDDDYLETVKATTSISTTPTIGNFSINPISGSTSIYTTSPLWVDSAYAASPSSSGVLQSIITVLTEDELTDLAHKIKDRDENYKEFIRSVVRTRHVSENFLMDNIDSIERSDVMIFHRPDLKSGQYSRLALYFEINK